MLISDLIRFKNDLLSEIDELSLADRAIDECRAKLVRLKEANNESITTVELFEKINSNIIQYDNMLTQHHQIKLSIESILTDIDENIVKLAQTVLYNDNYPFKYNSQRTVTVTEDNLKKVIAAIHQHNDWHYPGVQLTTRDPILTENMVSLDPLYLCDFDQSFIDQTSSKFNDQYNMRLRKYLIQNHTLDFLPQGQIGFMIAWLMFNYTGNDYVVTYLKNILNCLRPGGVFMFSYNNCDILESCQEYEVNKSNYHSNKNLIKLCQEIGYEIIESVDLPNNDELKYVSWMKVKKPGQLTTIKRHQVLGQLLEK